MASSSSSHQTGVLPRGSVLAGAGAETATEDQFSKWKIQCIYPNYIDKSKSTKEGRRMTHGKAVDRPTVGEMIEICQKYNIPFVLENKAYSRDWLVRGRLRVNLGAVTDDRLNTKIKLMTRMCAEIPSLASRAERLRKETAQLAALEKSQEKEAKKVAAKGKKK